MTKTLHGKVHGKTIELDEDLGVAEGQAVEVKVKTASSICRWGHQDGSASSETRGPAMAHPRATTAWCRR